jgi:Putative peptidoglycan binding domain
MIGCSLALAGAALAQPVEQQSPSKGKRAPEKTHAPQAQPTPKVAKPEERPAKQTGAIKERAEAKAQKVETTPKHQKAARTEMNVSGQPGASAARGAKQQGRERRKGTKPPPTNAKARPRATPATAGASAAPTVSAAGQQNTQANTGTKAKKPDPQQVQQIKSQHTSFLAQPKPQQVPAVTFNKNYRIQGSEQWQGPQYEVFRSYRPERHDGGWYRSHYNRVELIAGGYYYWNNGYWYPAWGYNPSAEYYAYDGPIYAGHSAEPPDKVIADVQAVLQEMGYYRGEVDGLLGPLTREALAAYQADQGLTTTAAIDQPTLDSLGMG